MKIIGVLTVALPCVQAFTLTSRWRPNPLRTTKTIPKMARSITEEAELVARFAEKMIDPNAPSSPVEIETRSKITSLLSKGWSSTDGFQIPLEQVQILDELMASSEDKGGRRPSTYGEITELGSRQLFHYMGILSPSLDATKEDLTFVDLGCGNAKLMVQAYMELPSLRHIRGIELAEARYQSAITAWNKLKEKATQIRLASHQTSNGVLPADMDIQEGDLFQMDLSNATHVYIASLCFTDDMMERLAQKMVDEGNKLLVVATLKPFPEQFETNLGVPQIEFLEMSWTQSQGTGSPVHFYRPV